MSRQRNSLQYLLDPDCQIFRGWNNSAEILKLIQVLMVEAVENLVSHHIVEGTQIANHSSLLRNRAADRDLKIIIVAVSVGVVALAVSLAIRGIAERWIMQAMRSDEEIAAGEVNLHRYSP